MITLILGDCLEKLKDIPDNSVDSIVTDAPYELGFMGKKWDSTGIAYNVDMWKECLRVLKPGGHLVAFGGTRTYHRMACAIEDAGFEVRDMIEWIYGSGFPKSHNVGLRIDQKLGLQGFRGKETSFAAKTIQNKYVDGRDKVLENGKEIEKYEGKSDMAKEYQGWGTNLKPAHEPICLARKPLSENSIADNVLKWGTGGLNIDDSRIGTEKISAHHAPTGTFAGGPQGRGSDTNYYENTGRFPANLIHDGSEEVTELFPDTESVAGVRRNNNTKTILGKGFEGNPKDIYSGHNDSGSAARFFKSIIYTPKESKSGRNAGCEDLDKKQIASMATSGGTSNIPSNGMERFQTDPKANYHPTVKPVALMEYLITMITPKGGTVLDPFMGSGTTGVACKRLNRGFIGIELNADYLKIAEHRINNEIEVLL